LSHKNTKLFITHCGNNGQYESVYHGVPMLGFPLFAEQAINCLRTFKKGFGLCMKILDFTSEELVENIQELLNNKMYDVNTKRTSAIIQSEIMSGQEKACHWIEHVIKFGGSHLRSTAMDVPLYQFLMLDFVATFVFIILLAFALCAIIFRRIKKMITSKPTTTKMKTNLLTLLLCFVFLIAYFVIKKASFTYFLSINKISSLQDENYSGNILYYIITHLSMLKWYLTCS